MNKKQKNGFTLVELLAVIVILAIILVIAVPKVMDVIKDSKKATLESTAKLIAGTAEKAKLQNQILGNNKEINCEDIVKINDVDYESCSIEFDGDTAKVTLVGSGKFEGLNVCNGTKTNSSGVDKPCSEVCGANEEQKIYNVVHPYEVDNVDVCVSFLTEKLNAENEEEMKPIESLCNGEPEDDQDFDDAINVLIDDGLFTKEELENYRTIVKPYEVNDIPSCVSYISTKLNSVGETEFAAAVEPLCNGQEVKGKDFSSAITMVIDMGLFTEEELIEANVIKAKAGRVVKPRKIEEVKVCVPKETTNGVTYLSNMVKDENARKAFGLTIDDTIDKNIRYVGKYPSNKVYFNCEEKDSKNVSYGSENYDYASSCEIWRIIGVFNVQDGNGNIEKRIKIVNTESTFEASWDSSTSDVNDGWGINQWGESKYSNGDPYEGADLMRLLNGYYIGKSGSTCRYCNGGGQETCEQVCDTEENTLASQKMKPLTSIAKDQIEDAVWNIGSLEEKDEISRLSAYNQERSDAVGSNTIINYTSTWKGKVGLIYPSDWAYASSSISCTNIVNFSCSNLNWLNKTTTTITRNAYVDNWVVRRRVMGDGLSNIYRVLPSLYLKHDIYLISGDGNNEPFILGFN